MENQQEQKEQSFGKMLLIRFQELILELISFKVLIFLLVYFSSREAAANLPYMQSIIDAVSGGGLLAYKFHKDKQNGIMGGEQ